MADILLDTQTPASTPGANTGVVYFDSVTKLLTFKNDTGLAQSLGGSLSNTNTAATAALSADTYLVGSSIALPPHLAQAKMILRWTFGFTKGAAGTVATTWNIRVGTAGSTADTSRVLFTAPVDTAAADTGLVEITAVLRNTGAAGVLAGHFVQWHNTPGTDLAAGAGIGGLSSTPVLSTISAGFDTTVASTIIGVSCNPGVNAYTFQVVTVRADNV